MLISKTELKGGIKSGNVLHRMQVVSDVAEHAVGVMLEDHLDG